MARWGEGVWGTFVWGSIDAPGRALSWLLDVDWDNDGLFNGTNEANDLTTGKGRLLDVDVTRGRQFFLKSDGTGFESVAVGTMQITLLDLDGRYNPYNASSPLFGYLQQNQKIQVRCEDTATGTPYFVFTGTIDDLRPNFGKWVSTATIYASDGQKQLGVPVTNQNIYQTIRYNAAISQILSDAGWGGPQSIDTTNSDTMPFWWESGRSAWDEIDDLTGAAFGAFCIGNDGTARYLSSVAVDESVMSLTEDDIDQEYGIQVPSPRETIKNAVTIYARARQQQNSAVLWTAIDKPSIAPGASVTIWATYSYNNIEVPVLSVTTPVATTDYTANTQADGGGTNKTANVSVSFYSFATTAKIIVTNNDAGTVYLTLMQVRGVCITADPYTFAQDIDASSIASYMRRDLVIQTDWLQDINSATDKSSTLLTKLASPRQFPRVMVKKSSVAKALTPDLFNLVSVSFPSKGIGDELRVGYIHTSWSSQEPNALSTELYFEPNLFANASGTWIFPALVGVTTKFA